MQCAAVRNLSHATSVPEHHASADPGSLPFSNAPAAGCLNVPIPLTMRRPTFSRRLRCSLRPEPAVVGCSSSSMALRASAAFVGSSRTMRSSSRCVSAFSIASGDCRAPPFALLRLAAMISAAIKQAAT